MLLQTNAKWCCWHGASCDILILNVILYAVYLCELAATDVSEQPVLTCSTAYILYTDVYSYMRRLMNITKSEPGIGLRW